MKKLFLKKDNLSEYIDGRSSEAERQLLNDKFAKRREEIKNFLQEDRGSFLIIASPGQSVVAIVKSLLPSETGNICLYADYHKPNFTMDTPDDRSICVDYEAARGNIQLCENLVEELEKMGWEKIIIIIRSEEL